MGCDSAPGATVVGTGARCGAVVVRIVAQRLAVGCTAELHLRVGRSSGGRAVANSGRSRPCRGYPQGALGCEGFHSTSRLVEARVSG
jgi:hypothetical protein